MIAGSHDLADTRCRRTVRLSLSPLCGTVPHALPCTLMRLRARWTHRPDGHGAAVGARHDDLAPGEGQRQASPDLCLSKGSSETAHCSPTLSGPLQPPSPTLACENFLYGLFQRRAPRAARAGRRTCKSAAQRDCPARGVPTVRSWLGTLRTLARSGRRACRS